ncbi:hypothetical protein B0H14DRAFT_2632391 [Mycena olivaceomarginata]|nr:hypothetical protein B0H14DRAFT_2632391 [Mycena olivaceomarginata]
MTNKFGSYELHGQLSKMTLVMTSTSTMPGPTTVHLVLLLEADKPPTPHSSVFTPTNMTVAEMVPDHSNPATPPTPRTAPVTVIKSIPGPAKTKGHRPESKLQAELQEFCLPDLTGLSPAASRPAKDTGASSSETDTSLSVSSITATTWDALPTVTRYFALWGRGIVYTDRSEAKCDFLKEEAKGKKPWILSTTNYDEAQAFAESVYWI